MQYAILPPRRLISCCPLSSLSRGVRLEPCNPLEPAVLPKRHAVKTLALHLGFNLLWVVMGKAALLDLASVGSVPASSQSFAAMRARQVGASVGLDVGSSKAVTYLSNFSIRSTWVMIIRRQQYRLQPSWSMASLLHRIASRQPSPVIKTSSHRILE